MNLEELRNDSAIQQKKGLHFIMASIIIWSAVTAIHLTELTIETKNLYTFFATAPLMPIAYIISKVIKADFTHKSNPLTNLGLLFSMNQMLYLLIAMWAFAAIPESMVMILAIIFGAHLLPYSWLYKSISYRIMSVFISITALIVGNIFDTYVLAGVMIAVEVIFSIMLIAELKKLSMENTF